jgi:hypothetical protein
VHLKLKMHVVKGCSKLVAWCYQQMTSSIFLCLCCAVAACGLKAVPLPGITHQAHSGCAFGQLVLSVL